MNNSILVLMSTYNGEKYIEEQILSVFNQTNVTVRLFIRDDGSKDKTIDIIKSMIRKGYSIELYSGENVGVKQSFQYLINQADTFEYYAFCDQDDIWYPDKLDIAIKCINKHSKDDLPVLYCCNQECVDSEGKNPKIRFSQDFSQDNVINTLLGNQISGCTMVFNNELIKCLRKTYEYAKMENKRILFMHDTWTLLVAQTAGLAIYDCIPHMAFRRHGNNVTESDVYSSMKFRKKIDMWIHKLRTYISTFDDHGSLSYACDVLVKCFRNTISEEDCNNLILIRDYKKSFIKWISAIRGKGIKQYYSSPKSRIYIKFILRVY